MYETALAYTNAEGMADSAVLFKLVARQCGIKHGIMPTFMAKPLNNMPGCSGHCHISLRDKSGKNVFAASEERKDAKWPELKYVSKECEHFLAGLLKGLPDVMPCMGECPSLEAPSENCSNRRIPSPDYQWLQTTCKSPPFRRKQGSQTYPSVQVENYWAPVDVSWGYESRLGSIRLIGPPTSPEAATRLEVVRHTFSLSSISDD